MIAVSRHQFRSSLTQASRQFAAQSQRERLLADTDSHLQANEPLPSFSEWWEAAAAARYNIQGSTCGGCLGISSFLA